jgi:hypothetical protein
VVTGEWRRLHNEKLNDLYASPNMIRVIKSRKMRRVGHVALMEKRGGEYRFVVGKTDGKRRLGKPRRKWENNIKTYLQEVGCGHGLD